MGSHQTMMVIAETDKFPNISKSINDMNKTIPIVVILFIIGLVSCKKNKNDWTGPSLSYKENNIQKRIYLIDSVQSMSRNLKSFEDNNRQL